MDIGTTDTAAFDLDVDVVLAELLGFELNARVSQRERMVSGQDDDVPLSSQTQSTSSDH